MDAASPLKGDTTCAIDAQLFSDGTATGFFDCADLAGSTFPSDISGPITSWKKVDDTITLSGTNVATFTTSSLTFVNQASAGTGSQYVMTVEPPGPIGAGETKTLKLTMRDPVWRDARIIDVNRPRIEVAGQLVFQDSSGTKNQDTILSSINPKLI